MKKPGLLRAAIVAFLPDLARDPDRLVMWVERGQLRATRNAQRGFSYEYQLTLDVENYTHAPELLFFIVADWLRTQQPDLLAPGTSGITFETSVIDDKTVDIQITMPLVERVTAVQVDGGWQIEVVDETDPMFPEAAPLRGADGPLTSIWVRGAGETFQVAPVPVDD